MVCRLAVAQVEAVPGDIPGNVARVTRLLEECRDGGADLALFPEAVITGYDGTVFRGRLPSLIDMGWLEPLRTTVDRTGVTTIVNTALQREGYRSLTDLLLIPGSEAVPVYDKQHLYDDERPVFMPGAAGSTITVNGLIIALSICYDANFPEHAAAAARAGAQVYVNSGAYFPGGGHRRDLHYAARALDNGMYVAFSGLVGGSHGFIGGSAVFDPLGARIAAVCDGEHIAFADLDAKEIDRARALQRMWAHRRDDIGAYRHHGTMP